MTLIERGFHRNIFYKSMINVDFLKPLFQVLSIHVVFLIFQGSAISVDFKNIFEDKYAEFLRILF